MPVQLGSALNRRVDPDLGPVLSRTVEAAIKEMRATAGDIKAEILKEIVAEITRVVIREIRPAVERLSSPSFTVPPPTVHVAAPQVSVEPPNVEVAAPRVEVNYVAEGFDRMFDAVTRQTELLGAILSELRKPVTTDVYRDSQRLIDKTVQRR